MIIHHKNFIINNQLIYNSNFKIKMNSQQSAELLAQLKQKLKLLNQKNDQNENDGLEDLCKSAKFVIIESEVEASNIQNVFSLYLVNKDTSVLINQLKTFFLRSQIKNIEDLNLQLILFRINLKITLNNKDYFQEYQESFLESAQEILIKIIERVELFSSFKEGFLISFANLTKQLMKIQKLIVQSDFKKLLISLIILYCAIIKSFNDKVQYFQRSITYSLLIQLFRSIEDNSQMSFWIHFTKLLDENSVIYQIFFSSITNQKSKMLIFDSMLKKGKYNLTKNCLDYFTDETSKFEVLELIKCHFQTKYEMVIKQTNAETLEDYFQIQALFLRVQDNNSQMAKLFKNNIRFFKLIDCNDQKKLLLIFLNVQKQINQEHVAMRSLLEQSINQITNGYQIYLIWQMLKDDEYAMFKRQCESKLLGLQSCYYLLVEFHKCSFQTKGLTWTPEMAPKPPIKIGNLLILEQFNSYMIHKKIMQMIESLKTSLKSVDKLEYEFYKLRVISEIK